MALGQDVVPLVAARRRERLHELLAAADLTLDRAGLQTVDVPTAG